VYLDQVFGKIIQNEPFLLLLGSLSALIRHSETP
jgi:hypothetical protein